MKFKYLKVSMLAAIVLAGSNVFAQTTDSVASANYVKPFSGDNAFRKWSVGGSIGLMTTNTIFTANQRLGFTSPNTELGYGGFVKYQVLPSFGLQADFMGGKLNGAHAQPDNTGTSPYTSFNTKIHYSLSLSTVFTLANINWHYNQFGIQPYLTAGAGTMNYTPELTAPDGTVTRYRTDNNGSINELFVPVGLGFKINLSPGVNLDLGYQVNFVYANNLDGYQYGFDDQKYAYAHAGLEFALGGKSKPQLATHNPVSSMRYEYLKENSDTRMRLQSEIDADNAQIADQKAKNDQLRNDLNNTNANLAKLTADSDGDGVPDYFDKCPNTPTGVKVDGAGCPLPVVKQNITKIYITEEDKKVVNEAVKNLEFEFNKATIRPHSLTSLDKLAQLLKEKGFNLKLAGYTDNVGSKESNMKLSKERAGAVKTYLISQGVADDHIKTEGYGESHPIAKNKTEHGRQLNRRVEFTLFQ